MSMLMHTTYYSIYKWNNDVVIFNLTIHDLMTEMSCDTD